MSATNNGHLRAIHPHNGYPTCSPRSPALLSRIPAISGWLWPTALSKIPIALRYKPSASGYFSCEDESVSSAACKKIEAL